ncbi:MAG: toll/interleukin-1 receptor domain-containing protein [Bacteroidales bacterium]
MFISHTSKDKKLVDSFVENILRLGCGFSISDIVFTSIESTGIKTGADMRNYLKQTLESCEYVFFMISENYKASGICLNEMGAAWALNKKVKPFLLPSLDYNDLEWLYEISKTSRINDVTALGTLHDEMLEAYGLTIHNTADWDKQKQKFIDSIKE